MSGITMNSALELEGVSPTASRLVSLDFPESLDDKRRRVIVRWLGIRKRGRHLERTC